MVLLNNATPPPPVYLVPGISPCSPVQHHGRAQAVQPRQNTDTAAYDVSTLPTASPHPGTCCGVCACACPPGPASPQGCGCACARRPYSCSCAGPWSPESPTSRRPCRWRGVGPCWKGNVRRWLPGPHLLTQLPAGPPRPPAWHTHTGASSQQAAESARHQVAVRLPAWRGMARCAGRGCRLPAVSVRIQTSLHGRSGVVRLQSLSSTSRQGMHSASDQGRTGRMHGRYTSMQPGVPVIRSSSGTSVPREPLHTLERPYPPHARPHLCTMCQP